MNSKASQELRGALVAIASHGPIAITAHEATHWASTTFAGTRHRITMKFGLVEVADAFATALPTVEFNIAQVLIADAGVISIDRKFEPDEEAIVVVEILALDDR